MCFCEECEPMRSFQLCSCGTKGSHALVDLLNPFLRLSLLREGPATQDRTHRPPVRKSLFLGETESGFTTFLGATPLTTELIEHRRTTQGIAEAKGMRHVLRQGHRLIGPCESLVRIAKPPQRQRGMATAHHARVLPIEEHRGAVLLGIIKRYALCQMRVRL